MADYYSRAQLARKFGLSEHQLIALDNQGLLQPAVTRGQPFYSSRQAYLLRAALHLAETNKLSLEQALVEVKSRPLYKVERPTLSRAR
jgi:DNA-binding transcriptional MerR regulator